MIDHVSVRTAELARSRAFYEAALAPLGYEVVFEFEGAVGLGAGGFPDFWIGTDEPSRNVHVAFRCDRAAVDAFHAAALAAGGTDNGAVRGRTTTRTTTAPSCWTPTGTTSKRSATSRSRVTRRAAPPATAG